MAETPEDRAHALRLQELDIERMKAEAALRAAGAERRSKLGVAGISVASAVVGAVASLGAALVSGVFDTQKLGIENEAVANLEQQKFSYDLIKDAMDAPDQHEQALRLQFFARIGLLPTVDRDELAVLVAEAERFYQTGGTEGLVLPSRVPASERTVGQVQAALNARDDCAADLVVDAVAGGQTVFCAAEYLGGGEDAITAAYALLWQRPDVMLGWLEAGDPPKGWSSQLAALGLEDRPMPELFALQLEQARTTERTPPTEPADRALDMGDRVPLIPLD